MKTYLMLSPRGFLTIRWVPGIAGMNERTLPVLKALEDYFFVILDQSNERLSTHAFKAERGDFTAG